MGRKCEGRPGDCQTCHKLGLGKESGLTLVPRMEKTLPSRRLTYMHVFRHPASLQGRCSKNPIAGGFIPNFISHPWGISALFLQMIYFNHFISPGPHSLLEKKPSPPIWFGLGVRLPSALRGGGGLRVQPHLERREPGVAGGGLAPAARTPRRAPSAPVQQAAASNICFQSLPHLTRAGKS